MKSRTAARLAWTFSGLSAAFGALFLFLLILNSTAPEVDTYDYWLASAIMAMVFPVVGALIVSRYPANALGWVLCVGGLFIGAGDFASQYATYTLIAERDSLPSGVAAAWVGSYASDIGFNSLVIVMPLLFPDGRPLSRGWWSIVWLTAGVIAVKTVSYAFMPGPFEGYPSVKNPFGIEGAGATLELFSDVGDLVFYLCLLASVVSLILRFRRSRGEERQQLKWFTYAVTLGPLSLLGNDLFPDLAWLIGGVSAAFIPLAIGIAILRYRLYDIDLIINRTLVYGALTACVVGLYVLIVGYLGAMFNTSGNLAISLVATGVVAVLFAPLRDRLQRAVNHLMYGERDDPYAVLSRLSQRLETTLVPEAVLPAIVETVREALKLPYAAIALGKGDGAAPEVAASAGKPIEGPLRLPLTYHSEPVGEMLLGPRVGEDGFSAADRRLLENLARQASVAAHAVRLTNDLQRSRARLVTTREEERRRIRRDLHDGLGPALSSAMLKLGAARRLLPSSSPADGMISEVREDMRATVADVRRLVYDLRPPALDQLGLVLAIHDYGEQCRAPGEPDGEGRPRVTVDAPEGDSLPPLPAAVEVAAYHIAREAITNAARHARARSCRVRLALEDAPERPELLLEISDDGVGLPAERHAGVGLSSMRERVEELGGKCTIDSPPEGGTRVLARLPVGKE